MSANLKFSGKTALVTGSSEGIGRSIALELAANGAFVVINSRTQTKCQKVVDEIKQNGGDAIAITADVTKVNEVKDLFAKISQAKPVLDIVVHSAGMFEPKPVADVTEEEFDRQFNLNTKGAFFVLQQASKYVTDGGRIITLSTTGTKSSLAGSSVFLATKGAIEQVIKSLAIEIAPRKITVNAVSPGFTDTNMLPQTFKDKAANASVFKRIGAPEDIAHVVTFLASPESGWITGQNIHVNGGAVIA